MPFNGSINGACQNKPNLTIDQAGRLKSFDKVQNAPAFQFQIKPGETWKDYGCALESVFKFSEHSQKPITILRMMMGNIHASASVYTDYYQGKSTLKVEVTGQSYKEAEKFVDYLVDLYRKKEPAETKGLSDIQVEHLLEDILLPPYETFSSAKHSYLQKVWLEKLFQLKKLASQGTNLNQSQINKLFSAMKNLKEVNVQVFDRLAERKNVIQKLVKMFEAQAKTSFQISEAVLLQSGTRIIDDSVLVKNDKNDLKNNVLPTLIKRYKKQTVAIISPQPLPAFTKPLTPLKSDDDQPVQENNVPVKEKSKVKKNNLLISSQSIDIEKKKLDFSYHALADLEVLFSDEYPVEIYRKENETWDQFYDYKRQTEYYKAYHLYLLCRKDNGNLDTGIYYFVMMNPLDQKPQNYSVQYTLQGKPYTVTKEQIERLLIRAKKIRNESGLRTWLDDHLETTLKSLKK
jgi:hypothetical protein